MVELKKTRKDLDDLLTEKEERAMAFTKQKYYDGGAKSLKILSYKLKKQQTKSNIRFIKNSAKNKMLTGKQEIAGEFAEYYEELYSPETEEIQTQLRQFLQDLNLPQVTNAQNQSVTAQISIEVLTEVIQKLKPDKSPGSDGFTGEFYISYIKHLSGI